jgi:hypothetical protein
MFADVQIHAATISIREVFFFIYLRKLAFRMLTWTLVENRPNIQDEFEL